MAKLKLNPPVRVGDRMMLGVESLASSGDGLCHREGYALFVPGGLPGDRVEAEVVKVTPRFGVTRILRLDTVSPNRIPAPCPVFSRCGGCSLQTLRYEKQMEFKVRTVLDSLQRIGKKALPDQVIPLPANPVYHYRNKGSFAVRKVSGKLRIGFFRPGTHEVEDSDQCGTLLPRINEVKEWLRELLLKHDIPIYDEVSHRGFLRGLLVRHSLRTGQTLAGLITTPGRFPPGFLQDIASTPGDWDLAGIVQNINSRRTNAILGDSQHSLRGRDHLDERLGTLAFRLSLGSFFQVNPYQTEKLYGLIAEWAEPGGHRVIDAYCGTGGISLWLARTAARVVGIDEHPPSVGDARQSARLNGMNHCEFLAGTMETLMDRFAGKDRPQSIVLDPPRKGCSEPVLRALGKILPERIVYVSCNPATLARDLGRLTAYSMGKIAVVDMFPQTSHVETVVLLNRR